MLIDGRLRQPRRTLAFLPALVLLLGGCGSDGHSNDSGLSADARDGGLADEDVVSDGDDDQAIDAAVDAPPEGVPTDDDGGAFDDAVSDTSADDVPPVSDAAPDSEADLAADLTAPDDVPPDSASEPEPPAEPVPEPAPDAGADSARDAPADAATDSPVDQGAPELPPTAFHWPNMPPASNPFPMSNAIREIVFTGRHALYGAADTWIPTWGSDDNLYSPWTYGNVNGFEAGSSFAWAKIVGGDPLNLTIPQVGTIPVADPGPYSGAFPAASLIVNGVWFYGGVAIDQLNGPCGLWCVMGPLFGFWTSTDYGAHWTPPPHGFGNALFGESAQNGAKVKMGGPRFVDFGKDLAHSPDGKAYLVGTGATDPNAHLNWVTGDQIYLARATISLASANDPSAWEFFAGVNQTGAPNWSHAFADIKPLLSWPGQMGSVSMTYVAPLGRYLMAVSRPVDGFNDYANYDTYFLEADTVTGPYRLVQYLHEFGAQAYYVNMPSRFISADGRTLWLEYSSGNYTSEDPPGSRYAMSFQEVVLDLP